MRQKSSVRFNYLMNVIYTVSGMLFPLLIYPYAARVLGEAGMGAVAFANSVLSVAGIFAQLGIPTYGIRACAKAAGDRAELSRTAKEILLINAVSCEAAYAALFAALAVMPRMAENRTLLLAMCFMLLCNTIGAEWLYKGLEEYRYIAVRAIAFKAAGAALVFLLVRNAADYIVYGALTVFAASGPGILGFLNLRRHIDLRGTGALHPARHLREIFVFWGMSAATTIYTNMDSVMLGFLRGTTENGCYDAAVKIKNILVVFITSLGAVMLPRMTSYVNSRRAEDFDRMTKKAMRFTATLSLPICLFFVLFARQAVLLVAGRRFLPGVAPLRILMPALALIGASGVTGMQILVPLGRERTVLASEIAGAAVNLAANAWLIPRLGPSGAAYGTLLAEAVVLAVQLAALRERVRALAGAISGGKIAAALIAASAASLWTTTLPGLLPPVLAAGVLFFAVYAGVLLLLREETACEIFAILKTIKK